MRSGKWTAWLDQLRRDRQLLELPGLVRGDAYAATVTFAGDLTGDAFSAALCAAPGSPALADFTVTKGPLLGGNTPVTLSLPDSVPLPPDDDLDGVTQLVFEIKRTPAGGARERYGAGVIDVSGGAE